MPDPNEQTDPRLDREKPTSPHEYTDTGTGNSGWVPNGSESVVVAVSTPVSSPVSYKTCKLVIKYYANGATGDPPATAKKTFSGRKKVVTLKQRLVGNATDMYKEGYMFVGWSTNSSATTAQYHPGDTITKKWTENEKGTVTYNLYAVWTNKGIFIYRPDEYANEDVYDKFGIKPLNQETHLLGALFTRTGYTQTGWKTNTDPVQHFSLGQSYTATSNAALILYPDWTANTYTITFRPNGLYGSVFQVQATYDADITIPNDSTFTRDGYHISVWNERWDGTASSWYPGKTYIFTRTSDVVVWAIWAGNEYFVMYDDDSTIENVPILIDYSDLKLDDNSCLYSESDELELLSNDVLYTSSKANYVVDSEINDNYAIATYGSIFYTEYRPVKENYTFSGWKTSTGNSLYKVDYCLDSYSISANAIWNISHNVVLRPKWSNKYPFGKLFYGRRDSSQYGIVIEQPPDYYWPERAFSHTSIKNRNGDILTDNGRYENVGKKYNIAVYNKNGFNKAANNLSDFLHRYDGYSKYVRLQDSYEPDVYMLAEYEEGNSLTNLLGQAGRTEISFTCKPQKYLISGNRKIDIIDNDVSIWNMTDHPASPIIKILGTGTITFYFRRFRRIEGGVSQADAGTTVLETATLEVYDNFNEIILDCETMDAVDINGRNMNSYISVSDKLFLHPGPNGITKTDNIDKITVIPRWWRL